MMEGIKIISSKNFGIGFSDDHHLGYLVKVWFARKDQADAFVNSIGNGELIQIIRQALIELDSVGHFNLPIDHPKNLRLDEVWDKLNLIHKILTGDDFKSE
jgi:hypothetical protein